MAVRIRTGAWAALIALAVMATALLPAPGQAQTADSFAELVRDLGAKSYSAKIRAVNKLAATGDDRAADILQAMVSRNLYSRKSDKRIFIGRKKGTQFEITDPITRKVVGVAEKSDLSRLRVNNRLRRTVRTALGALTLASKNPQKRLVAAQSIFKSPKAAQIDILRSALKKETDDEVLPEIVRALGAAELLHGKTSEIRIAAIGALGVYTDRGVSALLKSV
ncbi:MAG: urea transport system permease protein, partial [Alphaproteobacteria bacterium]